MANPLIPPAGASAKKKKQQKMILIGVAGAALLLFLYMRYQSGSSSSNATSAADQQAAIDQAVQNQQAQDAAMYGSSVPSYYGGGSSGDGSGSVDLSGVTSGLSTIDTDLQNLPAAIAAQGGGGSGSGSGSAGSAPPAAPPASPPITINVGPAGQPTGSNSAAVRMSQLTAAQKKAGDIAAPFGGTKPTGAPAGYKVVGTGSGNWVFRPAAPKTGGTSQKPPKTTKGKK